MPNSSTHESGTVEQGNSSFRVPFYLPAALGSFVLTRAKQVNYNGNVSLYFRDLVMADQRARVRARKTDPALLGGSFRTTITLPSGLKEFVTSRVDSFYSGNASAYFRALVIADHAVFTKLPPKQRTGWISPKRKVAKS